MVIDLLIPTFAQFYVLGFVALACFFISYFMVFHPMFRLSILNVFNRKPWTCWLCSNFWLSTFMWINLAYLWTPMFLVWGEILTALLCVVIKLDPMP